MNAACLLSLAVLMASGCSEGRGAASQDDDKPMLHGQPGLVPLFHSSDLVVRARAIERSRKIDVEPHQIEYQMVTFEVLEVFKAPDEGFSRFGSATLNPADERKIVVIAIASVNVSELLPPKYVVGRDYALFLTPITVYLYARSPEDDRQREHAWSPEVARELHRATAR